MKKPAAVAECEARREAKEARRRAEGSTEELALAAANRLRAFDDVRNRD
jgi:hypothetical protein